MWEWEENKFSMCSSSKSNSSPCNNWKEGEAMGSKTTECISNLPIRKIGRTKSGEAEGQLVFF